jgi:23S rRNA pseudouridine1911/1915/1917 synthase
MAERVTEEESALVGVVAAESANARLDSYLSKLGPERSRSEWQRLIEQGDVRLNGGQAKAATRVAAGDRVSLRAPSPHVGVLPELDLPLDVIYRDPAVIVIDKPPGLVVHPAPGNETGTLVNALVARFPELQDPTGQLRPGIVHRLDKDTSGLMVVARTTQALAILQSQMKRREVLKRYLLLVGGSIGEDQGQIDIPIARSVTNRQRMAVRADGKEALTDFRVLERFGEWTLVEARIHTGRTHQLRVHFQYIGHPVAGDRTYGGGRAPDGLQRQFVHAAYLEFKSPLDGRQQRFEAPLPSDLERVLEQLRLARAGR